MSEQPTGLDLSVGDDRDVERPAVQARRLDVEIGRGTRRRRHHAVRAIFVVTVGDLAHPKLRLPGLTAEIVQISVVVARLVVVLVVPAPEVLIESRIEFARPAHERHQPRDVVEHGIGVDPLVALGPAFLGARPGAVRVLRLHEAARTVVDVAVVVRAIDEEAVIRLPAHGSRDLRDRIIVVGVLERFRG